MVWKEDCVVWGRVCGIMGKDKLEVSVEPTIFDRVDFIREYIEPFITE